MEQRALLHGEGRAITSGSDLELSARVGRDRLAGVLLRGRERRGMLRVLCAWAKVRAATTLCLSTFWRCLSLFGLTKLVSPGFFPLRS